MQYESIKDLFLLYAGQPAAQHYETLIPAAIQEVERMLLPMADPGDPRLEQLAAALCNQRLQELEAPRDRAACTYAGTIAQQTDSTQIHATSIDIRFGHIELFTGKSNT